MNRIMRKKTLMAAGLLATGVLMVGCEKMLPPSPKQDEILVGSVPGLTPQQEHEHLMGDEAFGKFFTPEDGLGDRKSTRLNSSHIQKSRMPSSA